MESILFLQSGLGEREAIAASAEEAHFHVAMDGETIIGCCIAAAICFGIVSYSHFYRGRMVLVFAILAAMQLVLALMNYILSKKTN